MSRSLLRGVQCHACRHSVVQIFVAGTEASIPRLIRPVRLLPQKTYPSFERAKCFTTIPLRCTSQNNHEPPEPQDVSDSSRNQIEGHVPWYLRDDPVETIPHPLGPRQELPSLPPNPPPILQELLEHVSKEIGLDNLVLLDLRGLDPPPALGANLIMVVGTARSVKHLNVSADRLCRWLRSTHKLHPDADGLLGRNELKIKLRRKARRAKRTSATGVGSPLEQPDDGITTGWVCVNAGIVAENSGQQETMNQNFVGFGKAQVGPRIVVQLLTEEKRAEVDLEGLWRDVLERAARKEAKQKSARNGLSEKAKSDSLSPSSNMTDLGTRSIPQSGVASHGEQRRGMCHTRRLIHTHRHLETNTFHNQIHQEIDPSMLPESFFGDLGEPDELYSTDIPASEHFAQQNSMSLHLASLHRASPIQARQALGLGPHDTNSTSFLHSFYETLATLSPESALLYKLRLVRTAVMFQHPSYTKSDLFNAFQEFAASQIPLPRYESVKTFYALLSHNTSGANPPSSVTRVSEQDIEFALKVLDHMSLRNMNIRTKRILASLYKAVSFQVPVRLPVADSPGSYYVENSIPIDTDQMRTVKQSQQRLEKVIKAGESGGFQYDSADMITFLSIYFNQEDYDRFWEVWRNLALLGYPRTKRHYTFLFNAHAERGNQSLALKCLFDWFPMMEREEPPVLLDDTLSNAVMRCLLVAEPDVQVKAMGNSPGPLAEMWRQCAEKSLLGYPVEA